MNWWRDLKKEIKFCEPLSKHTTLKIGGIADIWFEPQDLKSLKKILSSCRKKGIPFLVIGNGSNLLVKEGGVRGVVIRLSSPYFREIDFYLNTLTGTSGHKNNGSLIAGCGGSLERLVNFARQKRLGGCEFLTGIPGTVGGALVTNAGVRDVFCPMKKRLYSIGDIVEEVTVIDPQGRLRTLERKDIRFGYRRSSLNKFILLKAKIKLKRKKIEEIESAIDRFMRYKKATQELIKPSAGSVFKNPPNRSAAELIELCGLKGFRIGDAQLSTKHTNFVINRGEAQARDVLALIKLVQDRVKAKHNVELEPEIEIIGE